MGRKINFPSREDVVNYYENTEKTVEEAADHFGFSSATMSRLLRRYKVHKNPAVYRKMLSLSSIKEEDRLPYEEFKEYYMIQNHSKSECCEHFNKGNKIISRWIKECGFKKTKEQVTELYSRISPVKKLKPSYEELSKEYTLEVTAADLAKKYNLHQTTMQKLIQKYGLSKTPREVAQTIKVISNKKYNTNNPQQRNILHYDIWETSESLLAFLKAYDTPPTYQDLAAFFGIGLTTIHRRIEQEGFKDYITVLENTSQCEIEVGKFISSLISEECIFNDREVLNKKEIDIYIPSKHLGVEYNGTHWHSDIKHDKNYHFNKSKLAEEKGIRLIHVYEYEWDNPTKRPIVESMLRIALGVIDNKIYARQCEIREISNAEARSFNEKNHLQGHRNAQVTYGLFYKDELVQLMSFSKTRYNRNLKQEGSWEIIRGCPGSNNIVVGGVSKLFKHFIKEHNPTQIFSYCDFNKFDGRGYEAIGMKFVGYTGPDMKWVLPGYIVVERQPKRHKELKEQAIAQIWGAGSKKYLWINNN